MIKSKIFLYELRRMVLSKAYLFLILLVCAYSVYALKTNLLRGYANTAPFSEWSFIDYLLLVTPFLSTILLFYVSKLSSPYEKNVMQITSSMPFSGPVYFLIKLAVIVVAYVLAALIPVAACFIFYGTVFGYFGFGAHALCILMILVPQLLFLQGLGLWIGRLRHNLVLVLVALIFFAGFVKLMPPYYLDVVGGSILSIPQAAIPNKGVIPFEIPIHYAISRVVMCVIGLFLIVIGCIKYNSIRRQKDMQALPACQSNQ